MNEPLNPPDAVRALAAICTWHGHLNDRDFERLVEQAREVMRQDWPELLKLHKQIRFDLLKQLGIDS